MEALIFGAGKIARGFLGQLLYRSGWHISFVDVNQELVDNLNKAGRYYVCVMGNEKESEWIYNFRCVMSEDMEKTAECLENADVIFTAVGGKNIESIGQLIGKIYDLRGMPKHPVNIICCENCREPGKKLRESLQKVLSDEEVRKTAEERIGVTDAVVMRSGIEPTPEILKIDPYAVSVSSYWELPVDRGRILGEEPAVKGIKYMNNFQGFLLQKIYTFNATNAAIAYLGSLLGISDLAEAANDPRILEAVFGVQEEINYALSRELKVSYEEQAAFSQKAIQKYQNRSIKDFTERHARDPLRKLGPEDRIVGVARIIEKHGKTPLWLCKVLGAALYYQTDNEKDPSAGELIRLRKEKGISYILKNICGIEEKETLFAGVQEQIMELKRLGWIDE